MQLHANMRQYNYTVYVTTGKLGEIRATFNKLRLTPGVMPTRSATPADTACDNCTDGITAGQPTLGRNPVFGKPANYSAFDNMEAPRNDAAGSEASGGGATAPVAVGTGRDNQGSSSGTSGVAVQVVEGQASNASDSSISEVKAAVTSTTASAASGQGDALLGAGMKPPAAGDAAARAAGAGGKQGSGADGKTVAGAVVAAFVGCALLAGTALAVVRSKKKAGRSASGSDSQQQPGQEAVSVTDSQAQQEEATVDKTAAAAATGSPVVAAAPAVVGIAASPLSPGVLTRSRAALANAQEQGTGIKSRMSDA
jgi:hypothetical protein